MTNKEIILNAEPNARLDYYESLRASGRPCWFIRHGSQGPAYTNLYRSPKAAWKAAAESFLAYVSVNLRNNGKVVAR